MKVVRISMFKDPDNHVDVVMREGDAKVPVEQLPAQMNMQDFLVTHELFEMRDGASIQDATAEASQHMRARGENMRHQGTLYFWLTRTVIPMLTPGRGAWSAKNPAPLSADEVAQVFEQIALHSRYQGQTLRTETSDRQTVVMTNGRVSRGPGGGGASRAGMNGWR